MEELIVLLDENLQPIGTAPKLAAHHADTPLHLAFSCYVFNEAGELLITQRAASKKVWPGVWSNSFCGHPMPNDSLEDAILRRGAFEIGLTDLTNLQKVLSDYRYRTPSYNGIVENEFCPVFIAKTASEPQLNPEEVSNYRWTTWQALKQAINQDPKVYSYWFKDQLPRLATKPALRSFFEP